MAARGTHPFVSKQFGCVHRRHCRRFTESELLSEWCCVEARPGVGGARCLWTGCSEGFLVDFRLTALLCVSW